MVNVEIVYILQNQTTFCKKLELNSGATVADGLRLSGIETMYPETSSLPIGIFSKSVSRDYVLKNGDRIEVYRQLISDPKDKRRERARKKRV